MTPLGRLATWCWERLPVSVGRFSRVGGVVARDGVHLLVWPAIAALGPVAAVMLGSGAALLRFGADVVFTESLAILALAVGLGFAGAQLGAWFVVAFGLSDLVLHDSPVLRYGSGVPGTLRLWAALPLTYVALATLAVVAPLLVQALRAQLRPPERLSPDAMVVFDAAVAALGAAVVMPVLLQTLPLLVRPVFTWQGGSPTAEAMFLVQGRAWLFALLAAVVAASRTLLEYAAAVTDGATLARVADAPPGTEQAGWWERRSRVTRTIAGALIGTWLLSGLLSSWFEALLTLLVLLAIEATRRIVLPRRSGWVRVAETVPALVRLFGALAVAVVVAALALPDRFTGDSFLPLLLPTWVSLGLLAAAFPEGPEGPEAPEPPRRPAAEQTP